jgi:hypothetical protein
MLELKELSKPGLAKHMKVKEQSLRNKLNRNQFSADDLILAADYLGVELQFVVNESIKHTLTVDDLQVMDKKPIVE